MTDPIMVIIAIAYTAVALVFLVNCAMEEIAQGGRPGLMVLAVAIFWPPVLVALVVQTAASRLWARA